MTAKHQFSSNIISTQLEAGGLFWNFNQFLAIDISIQKQAYFIKNDKTKNICFSMGSHILSSLLWAKK